MKLYIKVALIAAGTLALLSLVMSVVLVRELVRKAPSDSLSQQIQYHFALYLPQNRTSFTQEIIAGARRAASEYHAALTLHSTDAAGTELGMAPFIGADGIVVCPNQDDDLTLRQLEKLRTAKIPLVLINHNIPADQPWPFIGTNNFDLGKKAGNLVRREGDEGARIALVYSDKSPAIWAERELVEMGLSGALPGGKDYPILTERTDLNPRDAEKIVYQLVRTVSGLSTIIFTDANDTLAGTQALIELNMVGRIQIIGFGSVPAILEYIQKGIISGSLAVNPELIGYQAVKSLAELCATGYTSTSVDIGIDTLTREKK